jgi:protein required for attachment to host cells
MITTWVVVAESSRAKLFAWDKPSAPLRELEDLTHPESRLHEQELTTDLPGRAFDSAGEGRHAMGQVVSPKQEEAVRFAKTIGDRLESGRVEGCFEKLILVAAPQFLGLLRDSLSDNTKKLVVKEINKNLVQHDAAEIRSRLR